MTGFGLIRVRPGPDGLSPDRPEGEMVELVARPGPDFTGRGRAGPSQPGPVMIPTRGYQKILPTLVDEKLGGAETAEARPIQKKAKILGGTLARHALI